MSIIEHTLQIPLQPVACPRPRVSKFGTYYPKAYKDFQRAVKLYFKTHVEDSSIFDKSTEPIHITYTFVFNRPQYMKAKKYPCGRIIHTKRPDLDNLVKAMNDVIQAAGIINDDSQIYSMGAHKYYASIEEQASITLQIQKG